MTGAMSFIRLRASCKGARRTAASEQGMVAVEFALIAPFFLVLIFATMIFALYFATFVAVIHTAAEGARASIGGLTNTERGQLAQARVTFLLASYRPLLDPARATITGQAVVAGSAPSYKVAVSYPVSDFGFGGFYRFMNATLRSSQSAPVTVSYSVTVANGGY